MNSSKRLPLLLFIITVLGFGVLWYYSLKQDIYVSRLNNEIQALTNSVDEYEKQISSLKSNTNHKILSYRAQKIKIFSRPTCITKRGVFGVFPKTVCSQAKATFKTVRVPVTSNNQSASIQKKITQLEKSISSRSGQIETLSKKKESVEKPLGLSKQSIAAVFSFLVLVSALFVILTGKYKAESEKWAFGVLGTILGYWLG